MRSHRFRWTTAGALGVLALASGPSAFATSSTTQTIKINADSNYFDFGGSGGEFFVDVFTGMTFEPMAPTSAVSGSYFETFCLEYDEGINTYDVSDWTIGDSAHAGGVGGAVNGADPISPSTAYLYTQFYEGALTGYNYTPGANTRAASALQLQRAIWYLENELPSLNAVSDAQAIAWVNEAASANWADIGNVRVLTLTDVNLGPRQDLLVMTPEPPPPPPPPTDLCPPSAIKSDFNGTSIPAGRSVWFNSIMKVTGQPSTEFTIHVTAQTAVSPRFDVALPDANVTFSATATTATTTYDAGTNTWNTTVPLGYTGNVFMSGAMLPLPNGLAGGTKPVTWTATFSHPASVDIQWKWAAAAYNGIFSSDLSTVGVKPVDSNSLSSYHNSDHAGTPESVKSLVVGGARGGGGSNFTGSYSGTGKVCVD